MSTVRTTPSESARPHCIQQSWADPGTVPERDVPGQIMRSHMLSARSSSGEASCRTERSLPYI